MRRDMLELYQKMFNADDLPADVRVLRRRAYANLYASLSGHHLQHREWGRMMANLGYAAIWNPWRTANLVGRKLRSPLTGAIKARY
jgi:hypothetical protein